VDGYSIVTSGEVRLCVRDYGGDGPSMVCVHGAGGNIAAFDALADALTGSVRVITYDQRAYGESDGAVDLSLAAYVADLGAVVSAMCTDTAFVYGQSFGACVGLEYVATHPSRGFIDEDGPSCPMSEFCERAGIPVPTRSEVDTGHRGEHFTGTARDLDDLISGLGLAGTTFEPMLRRRMQPAGDGRLIGRPLPEELTRLVDEYQLHTLRLRDLYAALTAPTLWLAASHDEFVSTKRECLEELVALQPGIHVEWLPTGHTVSLERPDLVADLVRMFVDGPRSL
jgi:pimeloyl-ACP methyl ester carboxylesterase